MNTKPIYITKPTLPNLDELNQYLKIIWDNKILTNQGPLHERFEHNLAEFLNVEYISLFSNGTLALMTAIHSLELSGKEIITTPFSFVATSHAIKCCGYDVKFADINPIDLTLDIQSIEEQINKRTAAILPVNVFGRCCDFKRINEIAKYYNLKVIYDSAHCFGTEIDGISINEFGDLSILSFHATKVFNTFEGGAIISHDLGTKKRIDNLRNFGILDEENVECIGFNAKMNELQAAIGLLQLKYFNDNIEKRRKIDNIYQQEFKNTRIITVPIDNKIKHNYGYFPILVDYRDELYEKLKENGIISRKYFYPLISNLKPYKNYSSSKKENLPIANFISDKILCLPIYPDLEHEDVYKICEVIKKFYE